MRYLAFFLYLLAGVFLLAGIWYGSLAVGEFAINWLLFGAVFQRISELLRCLEIGRTAPANFAVSTRKGSVLSLLLFLAAVAALAGSIKWRAPGLVITAVWYALFGFLFYGLSLIGVRIMGLKRGTDRQASDARQTSVIQDVALTALSAPSGDDPQA